MDQVELYRRLHETTQGYGRTSEAQTAFLRVLLAPLRPGSLLDYGAGRSHAAEAVARAIGASRVAMYDPAVEERSARPQGSFDVALCTDVLEHVPEAELDAVLSDLAGLSRRVYFHIATIPAQTMLETGENAHCTIRPREWWRDRLLRHFDTVEPLPPMKKEFCRFVTWTPDARTRARIDRWLSRKKMVRNLKRRWTQLANLVRLGLGASQSRGEAMEALRGRRVAIVGNSQRLAEREHGDQIDAADIVIRFNRAPLMSYRSHGRRTDWLATALPDVKRRLLKQRGVRYAVWTGNKARRIHPSLLKGDPPIYVNFGAAQRRLAKALGTTPSSGMQVIDLVAESEAREIALYGFDFGNSGSLSGWSRPRPRETHDFAAEGRYVRRLAAEDPRFRLID